MGSPHTYIRLEGDGFELIGNTITDVSNIAANITEGLVSGNATTGCLQLFGSQFGLVPSKKVTVSENNFDDCNVYGIQLSPAVWPSAAWEPLHISQVGPAGVEVDGEEVAVPLTIVGPPPPPPPPPAPEEEPVIEVANDGKPKVVPRGDPGAEAPSPVVARSDPIGSLPLEPGTNRVG